MKKRIFIIALSLLTAAPALAQRRTTSPSNHLANASDSLSYALGFLAGNELADKYLELIEEIDFSVYQRSFQQALAGETGWLDGNKLREYVEERFNASRRAMYQSNIEAGERLLAANRLDPQIHETASGLQYRIVEPGRDPNERPRPYDDMHITYTGKTTDGEVFTSGEDEYSYPASEDTPGMTEGTQLMSPGARYIFYMPADLAYGEEGNGALKPYSVAVYEVYMNSMTRDHNYYDEDPDTVIDMNTWSEDGESDTGGSDSADDLEAVVRPAGDYTATTLANLNLNVSVNGYDRGDIEKIYQVEGFTIVMTGDRTIVLDSENREVFRNTLDEEDNSYDGYYLTEYRAADGTGPVFLVLDIGFDSGSYYGGMLYTIENGAFRQTDKYLALVNEEGGNGRLSPVLNLYRNDGAVEFRFDTDEMEFDPIGIWFSSTVTVSGADFWYVYRDGQITEAGPYTQLSSFRNKMAGGE